MGAHGPVRDVDSCVFPITMEPLGYFAAHYHAQTSPIATADGEVYEFTGPDDACVCIFKRDPKKNTWNDERLSKVHRWVFIPPGWHHAGLADGKGNATFNAHTRVSHTILAPKGT